MTAFERALYREIGERLKDARLHADLTQTVAADRLGMSRVNLARIEAGHYNLAVAHVYRAATIYDCALRRLLPPWR